MCKMFLNIGFQVKLDINTFFNDNVYAINTRSFSESSSIDIDLEKCVVFKILIALIVVLIVS